MKAETIASSRTPSIAVVIPQTTTERRCQPAAAPLYAPLAYTYTFGGKKKKKRVREKIDAWFVNVGACVTA